MINKFEKLMEEFLLLTPRKGEPEFLFTKPREEIKKQIVEMNNLKKFDYLYL